MRKPTIKKALLWTLLSLLVLIAILVVFVLAFDWNRGKPYINRRLSEAIGRVFEIRGNLALHWQKPADSHAAVRVPAGGAGRRAHRRDARDAASERRRTAA